MTGTGQAGPSAAGPVVDVHAPERRSRLPVLLDTPHSGTFYPDDFCPFVDPVLLAQSEDRFVDELLIPGAGSGVTFVRALFARTYIDPDRALDDLDVSMMEGAWSGPVNPGPHTERGAGLVFRLINGIPIYDRNLEAVEVQQRIDRCWKPYHLALGGSLDELHRRHGAVWHLNCHSMEPVGTEGSADPQRIRPDFVLGDRSGGSCAPSFTAFVRATLENMGYSVAVNDPYNGAYIVEHYGRPREGRHTLQLEINRGLYMYHQGLEKHAGFTRLRSDLGRLMQRICTYAHERVTSV